MLERSLSLDTTGTGEIQQLEFQQREKDSSTFHRIIYDERDECEIKKKKPSR